MTDNRTDRTDAPVKHEFAGINKVKDKDTLREAAKEGHVTADTPAHSPVTDTDIAKRNPSLTSDAAQVKKHPDDVNKDGTGQTQKPS